ncbi:hypothetical protein EI94DRAFT_1745333 [Lactarius quietus]|nr:hypothetical protein EI94DRAFT_1745333 [Lactarius quietus]
MPILIPTFLSYLLLIGSVRGQVQAAICTDDSFSWTFNSLHQSPCLVAAYLGAACSNGSFVLPSLPPQNSYVGPSGDDDDDQCKCNTVAYNLISACDACQGEPWIPYSEWSYNCTINATVGTFPEPVPDETRVPRWAYLPFVLNDTWDIMLAQFVGDFPEATGPPSIIPTSTSHHTSNTDAIVGGGCRWYRRYSLDRWGRVLVRPPPSACSLCSILRYG